MRLFGWLARTPPPAPPKQHRLLALGFDLFGSGSYRCVPCGREVTIAQWMYYEIPGADIHRFVQQEMGECL